MTKKQKRAIVAYWEGREVNLRPRAWEGGSVSGIGGVHSGIRFIVKECVPMDHGDAGAGMSDCSLFISHPSILKGECLTVGGDEVKLAFIVPRVFTK